MYQPLTQSLGSKLLAKIQGKSVVDNEANPASALNMQKRRMQNAGTGTNPKNEALKKNIEQIYSPKSKVRTFGTPLAK